MRYLPVYPYWTASLGLDPGPDMDYRGPRKLKLVKPKPQTAEQKRASENDSLTWEEFLSRG